MSGLAGQAIGLDEQSPTPIGGPAALDAESKGSMENFIGFGSGATSYDPAPVDFDADDDTVTSATDGTTRYAPEYTDRQLTWGSGVPDPVKMFANGEQGVIFNPSDFTTMFQDDAGSIPVTSVGQSVRKILDTSGNGNDLILVDCVLAKDSDGFYCISYNGTTSSSATPSIDLTNTSKVSLFAGVSITSDASGSMVAEFSPDGNSNPGGFSVLYGFGGASYRLAANTSGASGFSFVLPNMPAPFKHVASVAFDNDGIDVDSQIKFSGNGVKCSIVSWSVVPPGNFGNWALNIGSRVANVFPMAGYLYPVVMISRETTAQETADTQNWINNRTGAWGLKTPYLGAVATRFGTLNTTPQPGMNQVMGRKFHYARDDITSLKLAYSNFYAADTPVGSAATVTASVEYPEGVFTQVLFGGLAAGTIPNGGLLLSDSVSVSIPNGAKFYTRIYQTCASGFSYSAQSGNTSEGDVINFAASGVADKTMSNPMPANLIVDGFVGAVACIGMTTKPTVALIGDSRQFGFTDVSNDDSGNTGEMSRSLCPVYGAVDLSVSGETATAYPLTSTNRASLVGWCTTIASNYGVNDVFAGTTAENTFVAIQNIRGKYQKPFVQSTIPTETSSTDGFATLDNQTPLLGEVNCLALNELIRDKADYFNGVYDFEGVVNSVNTAGNRAWLPGYTSDGVHELNTANGAIEDSGIVDPSLITR